MEEQRRDPFYMGCTVPAGEPCVWAQRFDKVTDPPFHSERIEAAAGGGSEVVNAAQVAIDEGLV